MANLKDTYTATVQQVTGKLPKQKAIVTKVIDDLSKNYAFRNESTYYDLMSAVIRKANNNKELPNHELDSKINDVFKDQTSVTMLQGEANKRSERYKQYKEIKRKIPLARRALNVTTSNILSPDNIARSDFVIRLDDDTNTIGSESAQKDLKDRLNAIISHFKLEKSKKRIISKSLLFGDCFVEIVNINDILRQNKLLVENKRPHPSQVIIETKLDDAYKCLMSVDGTPIPKTYKPTFRFILENMDYSPDFDVNSILESENININVKRHQIKNDNDDDDDDDENEMTMDDIILKVYDDPSRVVILGSSDFVIGYLVFPKTAMKKSNTDLTMGSKLNNAANANLAMNQIINNIMEKITRVVDPEFIEDNTDLRDIIVRTIMNKIDSSESYTNIDLNVRYVPENRMQHFKVQGDEYEPYGTSIFDNILFDSKLLLSSKTAATIDRLTRAVERRLVHFELENRDSRRLINIIKEALTARKFKPGDDDTSLDAIPSTIASTETIYVPMQNGEPVVKFDALPSLGSNQQNIDDMKFLRDEIATGTEIPAPYLGIEENIESKSTLSQENVIFAVYILSLQSDKSDEFTSLVNKIRILLGDSVTDNYTIGFNQPMTISTASEIEHINAISGIKDMLLEFGLTNKDIIDKYIPQLSEYITRNAKVDREISNMLDTGKLSNGTNTGDESGGEI